jgi:hypothetical protein
MSTARTSARAFDARCCSFLRVDYGELKARVLAGDRDDEQLLAWCHERGGPRSDEECEVWNGFMAKRGWRDPAAAILATRIAESRLDGRAGAHDVRLPRLRRGPRLGPGTAVG